jgi:eukaryotic-like serine/threonine-protein kinase
MGRESDSFEDEGTWHQPLPENRAGRPHDQVTTPESESPGDPAGTARATAPDATKLEQTSPSGDLSRILHTSSSDEQSDTDPHRTDPLPEGSADWDALPPPVLQAGHVVFDKYRLVAKIGEGGMGEVWRVWHVSLEAERALKLIKSELAHNEKGWRRFQREARVMAKINHPNAVSVYDFRRIQSVAYIEMEFIRGRSLSDVLKDGDGQPMPVEWTSQVLDQLCAVLQEAHGHLDETNGEPRPIIHRDLKPSNLMLVERKGDTGPPRLKVLDFGIAKIVDDESSPDLTGAGDLVGTPAFMSPEQIRWGFERDGGTHEIDGRSDIYSTGVVLYHLLTGALPFRGGRMALLSAHLHDAPLPMKEANPKAVVPPEVERVVRWCLEKEPAKRPQTARELAESFQQAAGLRPAGPRRAFVGARSRRPIAAAAAGVLVAAIALGAVMLAWTGRRPSTPIDRSETSPVASPTAENSSVKMDPAVAKTPSLRVPEGYAAENRNNIVPGHPGIPVNLRRLDDNVKFVYRDGIYLPVDYEPDPESVHDLVGAKPWPRVIRRIKRPETRFIRIEGTGAVPYLRGDPRANPADDAQGNQITPHYVHVRSFYIQETEVTNGEIESYASENQDDASLKKWTAWLKKFREDHPDPAKYPAACRDYDLARNYARWVGGLLPTETQWEWAAKSRDGKNLFAWGESFSRPDEPPRANLNSFALAPVKAYGKEPMGKDRTKQEVYDMVGNQRELCADTYAPYSDPKFAAHQLENPLFDKRKPVDLSSPGTMIVVRGGSITLTEDRAMAFHRSCEPARDLLDDVGFRVVIECPDVPD